MAPSEISKAKIIASRRVRPQKMRPVARRRSFIFLVHELLGSSRDVQYEVTRELGRGSEGIVYKARVKSGRCHGRLVALKAHFGKKSVRIAVAFLHIDSCRGQGHHESVLRSTLHHPNLVDLYHYFVFEGVTYTVMELCAQKSLHEILESRGRLPEEEIRPHSIQLLGGVNFLAGHGIVHGDLKPRNILIDDEGNLKICDFGLGARLKPGRRLFEECGTLQYMAPETLDASGAGYGTARDIWSVGVVM